MPYITAANVEDHDTWSWPSGITSGEKDAAVQQASDIIDQVTRSHWEATTKTLYMSGDGSNMLDIYTKLCWPAISITSITFRNDYNPVDDFDTIGTVIAATDYRISDSRRSIIRVKGTRFRAGGGTSLTPLWQIGDDNFRVIGSFGRANTPTGITLAAKLLVRELVDPGSTTDRQTVASEKWADGYSYVRSGGPTARNPERLTGYGAVDDILIWFVDRTPFMAVP